ncbi:1-deoxy-D-xylulose 5-phosphate reductoisomerase [Helicobacter mustelae]|uniref:1-deoxy-D-xylulose-5-phosphate reductoisomerase n=1 Tax=Helicobacter mustelae TaxID=217 RepID=UPI000E021D33|nr:1-deoxy-D-xylulose-5-phosphate reductoisomerase [Helicobacter mustelae]STP12688.1 1-deoxy-D-xylulose 5-phosphate reductoisomerase [Helicobacter mustelae]
MVLLGSTGSIGVQTLSIAKLWNLEVEVLCAGRNIPLLNEQIAIHRPKIVVIQDRNDATNLKALGARVLFGDEGILQAIADSCSKLVVNALVGLSGLAPSLEAKKQKKTLALANKESLVSGGWLLQDYPIIPVDSEHFGIWYLLSTHPRHSIQKLCITASGGAFRDTPIQDIATKKLEEALCHPNWKMGNKITIDSATMVNKLFELLEAKWLFGIENLDALIERSSIVHAIVSFKDGSSIAHFANPDMALPISYALNPIRAKQECLTPALDFCSLKAIAFEEISPLRYPIWEAREMILQNPRLGAALNSANDILVVAFLEQSICFGEISRGILSVLEHFASQTPNSLQEIFTLHQEIQIFLQCREK